MLSGTIKWFNSEKEYGFIVPAAGDADVYLPLGTIRKAGVGPLETGMVVRYTLAESGGKVFADTLTLIDITPAAARRSAEKSRNLDPYSDFEREWALKPA